jgi:hypothetical protein
MQAQEDLGGQEADRKGKLFVVGREHLAAGVQHGMDGFVRDQLVEAAIGREGDGADQGRAGRALEKGMHPAALAAAGAAVVDRSDILDAGQYADAELDAARFDGEHRHGARHGVGSMSKLSKN